MPKPEMFIKQGKRNISLDRYAGEWVAFANGKVVAHQTTLRKLMRRVEKLKKKPSVLLVPKKTEGPYV